MGRIPFDHRPALPLSDTFCEVSRRGFLATSLAVGFAQAVQPVSAQTITTGTDGLIAGEVKVPVAGGVMPAYQAYPATGGPFPTVLVIQEIFGVHEHIKDVCRRLARLGYFAISGELYARQGDVSRLSDINEIFTKVVSKVPDDQVMSDLDSLVDFAHATGKADIGRLGVTGFCWGGRATWLYAAHRPSLKAAIAWYGMVDPPPWNPKATGVFALLPKLTVPVLGLYGEEDKSIPADRVRALAAQLAGTKSEIVLYPGVGHAFHADYRPSYDKTAAEDGWKRLQAWLKRFGVA
jgi:carboxymethylenebutenolidase